MKYRYTPEHVALLNSQIEKHFPHIQPVTSSMHTSYEGIARLVMLDRYANKDIKLDSLSVGDLVIAKIKNDIKFPTFGTAFVTAIKGKKVTVQVEEDYIGQIDEAYEAKEGLVELDRTAISKPLEIYYEQIATRVGKHLAEDEKRNALNK